jgi:hypothetical protein
MTHAVETPVIPFTKDFFMLAGVASADFTPKPGMILQGHWSTNPSTSVLYPLEMRTIAFRQGRTTCVIITLDLIGLERRVVDRIRKRIHKECGVHPQRVMMSCSHTHCAPPAITVLGMKPPAGFLERIEELAASTTREAIRSLQPVTLGLGCSSAYFNVNRRPFPGTQAMAVNEGAILDRRARVLRIDGANGKPLAVMFHYSCHPTSKSGSEGIMSPDYPGIARTRIEKALKCRALFLPGCFANVRPRILAPGGGFGSATKAQLDQLGDELARAVCSAARATRTVKSDTLTANEIGVSMPFGKTMSVAKLREFTRSEAPIDKALRGPWARDVLQRLRKKTMPKSERTRMQAMTVGPLAIVTIPGEPAQEIGDAIERTCRPMTSADDLWPTGYTNDIIGYLCTARQYGEGGYEPTAYPLFGRPAPFKDEEKVFLKGAATLLNNKHSK